MSTKTGTLGMVFALGLLVIPRASAGEEQETPPRRMAELRDGSRVIGTLVTEALPVTLPYGKLNLPMKHVERVDVGEDAESVTVHMTNKDVLRGAPAIPAIRMKTVFGDCDVAFAHIRRLGTERERFGPNVLKNPDLKHGSWGKTYNRSIRYSYDSPAGRDVTVASFEDANGDGGGYWYCYSDMAPQEAGTTYRVILWVKSEAAVRVRAYTADNNEKTRRWGRFISVKPEEGWRLLQWTVTTAPNNDSNSLSFNWGGLTRGKRMWIAGPTMRKWSKTFF